MTVAELVFGRPLRNDEEEAEQLSVVSGLPVLGLDALASASYGPEAALTALLPLATLAPALILPITGAVVLVLVLVFGSYLQTIAAYPSGGGSYSVARENLGRLTGVLAAAALTIDYVLNVAVAISAGVGALVSAVPELLPATLPLCLGILVALTLVNLRGPRSAGLVLVVPTYAFVLLLGGILAVGAGRLLLGGEMRPVASASPSTAFHAAGAWLVLRAFASGCTAMTGVEAVSNAVPVFREPKVPRARRTLTVIVFVLAALLVGIAYLARAHGIEARTPGAAGYESVLSQVVRTVAGRGALYGVTMATVLVVLAFSANTSFADFPRVWRLLALDGFLPAGFAHRGARLVYSQGIVALALLAGALLVAFGGVTDRLIPLFAVGALLAFTLSQLGMVVHWHRVGGRGSRRSLALNAAGALATGATLAVMVVSKFTEGAWLVLLVLPLLLVAFLRTRRWHRRVERATDTDGPLDLVHAGPPLVIVPVERLDAVTRKALRFAVTLSPTVQAVHVVNEDDEDGELVARWEEDVRRPVASAGLRPPDLAVVRSPYRELIGPIVEHVLALADEDPERLVVVVLPELVRRRWWHPLVHNHRATLLRTQLLLRAGPRIVVADAPWYLND